MNGITIYLEPNTVKFFLGLYACWTALTLCLFADWIHQGRTRLGYFVAFSFVEKLNMHMWGWVTILLLAWIIWG